MIGYLYFHAVLGRDVVYIINFYMNELYFSLNIIFMSYD